jgi:outer membrane protein assembly factor BamB
LYKNLVIITASIESQALVALDKDTGKEVWRQEAAGLASTWGTPVLVPIDDQRTDLVLAVPYELWALNPEDGKLRWYCESIPSDSMCSSAVTHDGIVYALESGPRGGGAVAIRAGGKDDVSESHVLWRGQDRSRIGTPVFYEGHLYWISSGIARCIDAKTGESVYEQRLSRPAADAASDTPADDASPEGGGRFGRGGGPGSGPSGGRFGRGGGRGGPGGGSDYASPVVADGKLVFLTRAGNAYVVQLGTEFKELGCNRFSDGGDFSATPAISDGQLFIRSSKYLYCVADSTP